ncbi:MAG: DUF364 domain-containing protein [Anaerolineales bacterium]
MNRDTLLARLLPNLPDGKILDVHIGLYWTAVVAEVDGAVRCGLSATMSREAHHTANGTLASAGHLTELPARQLADYIHSPHPLEISVGMAAINALLPPRPDLWVELHSKEVLARLGAGKTVVMVGHFPYVPELRPQVGRLLVLELNPKDEQDLPAQAAPQVIPQADVLAVTAMTLLNHTFDELIALRRPDAPMVIVGPSTPLSTILFEAGAVVLSGAVVENPMAVLRGLKEGANFHQLRRMGVRLVSMTADPALIDRFQ